MTHVRLKCVYERRGPGDGLRVLVEAQWPRGVSLGRAAVNVWARELAPSPALAWRLAHEPENWPDFGGLYRAELAGHAEGLQRLVEEARRAPLTLLYSGRPRGDPARRRLGRHGTCSFCWRR